MISPINLRIGTTREIAELALKIPEFDDPHGICSSGGVVTHALDHILVAELDGRPSGFRACYRISPDTFGVWMAAVLPEARECGVYAILFKVQNEELKALGGRFLETTVRATNVTMLDILLRRGFSVMKSEFDQSMQAQKIFLRLKL